MRRPLLIATALVLAAAPLSAQTPTPLLGSRTVPRGMLLCMDRPVTSVPVASLLVAGGHNSDGRESLVKGDAVVLGQRHRRGRGRRPTLRGPPPPGHREELPQEGIRRRAHGRPPHGHRRQRADGYRDDRLQLRPHRARGLPRTVCRARPAHVSRRHGRARSSAIAPTSCSARAAARPSRDGDVLSIDRGAGDGVTTGARFAIYRDMHNGLPLVHIGEAVVVVPLERTSALVLVSVTRRRDDRRRGGPPRARRPSG